ncbi:MAG: hypothetical protein K0R80_3391 [Clostridia bacterium]|nr:hypothetical protein [Clostridia bacterium]
MSREQKKLIRTSILEKRNSLTPQEIKDAEKQIINNLLKLTVNSKEKMYTYLFASTKQKK